MLHKEFNNGLRAYPIHQAVQAMGSTAFTRNPNRACIAAVLASMGHILDLNKKLL
jgi:hypothetical protein